MYAQIDKPKENRSRAVANPVTQKKSNEKQGFGLVDNRKKSLLRMNNHFRPETIKKMSIQM